MKNKNYQSVNCKTCYSASSFAVAYFVSNTLMPSCSGPYSPFLLTLPFSFNKTSPPPFFFYCFWSFIVGSFLFSQPLSAALVLWCPAFGKLTSASLGRKAEDRQIISEDYFIFICVCLYLSGQKQPHPPFLKCHTSPYSLNIKFLILTQNFSRIFFHQDIWNPCTPWGKTKSQWH